MISRAKRSALVLTLLCLAGVASARPIHYGAVTHDGLADCDALAWHGRGGEAETCYAALLTSDAGSIARYVDAVSIISRAVNDKRGMVSRTMAQFRDQQAVVLGVILNGVRTSVGGYFRENYQAFYKYRGSTSKSSPSPVNS